MAANLWFTWITLVVGWLALAPAARRLGPLGYHVAAFPIGVLGWTAPAVLSMALVKGYSWPTVLAGLSAYVFVVWKACVFATRTERRPSVIVPIWSFIAVGALVSTYVLVFTAWSPSVSTYDGWGQYELESWRLHDTGRAGMRLLSARTIALPAAHAGYHFLGGEYTTILFPLLSLSLAALVGASVWWATRRVPTWARLVAVAAILAGMISNIMYLFMSIYVHSHMMIAGFLVLSLVATERATADTGPGATYPEVSYSWLLVSGMAMAGFVLARPDSPAYVVVPLLPAIAILVRLGVHKRAYDWIMAPLTLCLPLYVGASLVQRGMWTSNKSKAWVLFLFAAVYAMTWLMLRFVPLERLRRLRDGASLVAIALTAQAIIVLALIDLFPVKFAEMFANEWVNLTQTGGWGSTLFFVIAFGITSIVVRPRSTRNRFRDYAGFAFLQFVIVATVIHGLTHTGRVGWGDSLNRVTFHALPVFYVYLGIYVGELLTALTTTASESA